MSYKEYFEDWDYLFNKVGIANDMTGGYVDQEDLDRLLKNPRKATAKSCLSRQIDYWFSSGIEHCTEHAGKSIYDLIEEFPKIEELAEKHCADLSLCPQPFCRHYS